MPSIVFGYAWISCHKGGRRRPGRYPRLPVDNIRRRSVGFPTSMELSNDAARTGPPRRRKDETLRYASIYMLISLSGVSGAAMPVRQRRWQRPSTQLQKGKMPYSFPTKRRCRILANERVKKSDLSGVALPVRREIALGPPKPSPRTCLPPRKRETRVPCRHRGPRPFAPAEAVLGEMGPPAPAGSAGVGPRIKSVGTVFVCLRPVST